MTFDAYRLKYVKMIFLYLYLRQIKNISISIIFIARNQHINILSALVVENQ